MASLAGRDRVACPVAAGCARLDDLARVEHLGVREAEEHDDAGELAVEPALGEPRRREGDEGDPGGHLREEGGELDRGEDARGQPLVLVAHRGREARRPRSAHELLLREASADVGGEPEQVHEDEELVEHRDRATERPASVSRTELEYLCFQRGLTSTS